MPSDCVMYECPDSHHGKSNWFPRSRSDRSGPLGEFELGRVGKDNEEMRVRGFTVVAAPPRASRGREVVPGEARETKPRAAETSRIGTTLQFADKLGGGLEDRMNHRNINPFLQKTLTE